MSLLENYILRHIVAGLSIAAAILLPLFSFLDLIEQLDDVGEGFYQTKDAFLYVAYLLPRRFIQLAPFIALLGTVIGLGRLAVNLELITMRAAGLSPMRISFTVFKAGLMLLVLLAVLEQFIAPNLQQKAIAHRAEAMAQSTELGKDLGTWTRDKRQVLRIGENPQGSLMRRVEIILIDEDGRLAEHIFAEYAEIKNEQVWELSNVTIKTYSDRNVETNRIANMNWVPFLDAEQMSTLNRPAESLSPSDLYEYVAYLKDTGQKSDAYELILWRKFGGALVTIAMVLLSVPFVFGSVRGGIANRLVLAGITGICVYLLDQIVANVGLLLDLSFPLVAFAPGLLLIWLAIAWLQRLA
ncbi:MAG: LPS export ABC transporter permease LptG [Gammaproteobacteria bacterium]|jgi:lipopolysaccharide export system permease protein|nr:LPS export ABC transporter permease LptG [Gammaproteobacteria bacterium]